MIIPITGNHDLLIIHQDSVHNYESEYLRLAEIAYERLLKYPDLYKKLFNMPAKIITPFFSAVHESVKYPYYAKITKLKKKSHDYGKTPDENLEAVFYSSLSHPYFTGSDHQAYMISGAKLKRDIILPNDVLNIKGSKVVSVPSISLSKDSNYTHGYCIVTVEDDESLTVEFKDIPDILISGMLDI